MKKESFEEKGLNEALRGIDTLQSEIASELSIIQTQLEKRGKWDDFIEEAARVKVNGKNFLLSAQPCNCFESLHLVFNIVEHYEILLAKIEESRLLEGRNMESIAISDETLDVLADLGISIEPGPSHASPVQMKNLHGTMKACYLASLRIRVIMENALGTLRISRKEILENYM